MDALILLEINSTHKKVVAEIDKNNVWTAQYKTELKNRLQEIIDICNSY